MMHRRPPRSAVFFGGERDNVTGKSRFGNLPERLSCYVPVNRA
ncbi:hypothetical protein HMPREF1985_01024 [Mitsuokella sp. oral taxon 131 str. W9106]|nr:hypothetical protein HMPREF1985_01024 [Mitsuokella sp. oral taxon 131 str. W9106]